MHPTKIVLQRIIFLLGIFFRSPSRSDEILPDLTVESGVATVRRFPSDLIETSVDPETPVNLRNETRASLTSSQLSEETGAIFEQDPATPTLSKPQVLQN